MATLEYLLVVSLFHIHVSWVACNRKCSANQDKQAGGFASLCTWKIQETRHWGDWSSSSVVFPHFLCTSFCSAGRSTSLIDEWITKGRKLCDLWFKTWRREDMASAPALQQKSGPVSLRACAKSQANEHDAESHGCMCCSALVIRACVLEASLHKYSVRKGWSRNLGTVSKREGLQQVLGALYMSTKSPVWKLWGQVIS